MNGVVIKLPVSPIFYSVLQLDMSVNKMALIDRIPCIHMRFICEDVAGETV